MTRALVLVLALLAAGCAGSSPAPEPVTAGVAPATSRALGRRLVGLRLTPPKVRPAGWEWPAQARQLARKGGPIGPAVVRELNRLGITVNGVYTPPSSGLSNPLTADLDADAYSLLDVGQINFGPATVSTPAIRAVSGANGTYELVRADGTGAAMAVRASHSGGVYYESADSANYVRPHSGGVDVVAGSGTLSLDADTVLGSGKTLTGGTLSWTTWSSITGSWSTNTTYTGTRSRIGNDFIGRVKITLSGDPGAGALTINLPSGLTIDTTAHASPAVSAAVLGYGQGLDAGTLAYPLVVSYHSSDTLVVVNALTAGGTYAALGNASAVLDVPFDWQSGDSLGVEFRVTCTGW